MVNATSQLEKEIGSDRFPPNERYFGLVNFGNTCYCNSVLQALYFCKPFREKILQYRQQNKCFKKDTLLTCLADLFYTISSQKKKVGQISPKKFIQKLKKENTSFDNFLQQDAHEFLNYLLNRIADLLQCEKNLNNHITAKNADSKFATGQKFFSEAGNWIHDIFQGTLTNETKCLNCETVRTKDEDFIDLSVDVEQDTSISHCLQCFSNTETIQSDNKYYCEVCCCKQEAQKRMRIKRLPLLLALHLKRFKYHEAYNRFAKLSYRVAFPLELRLYNTSDDATNPNRMYELMAVVVHSGSGPNRGHYISLVKSHGLWLLFDDDYVDVSVNIYAQIFQIKRIESYNIADFFGVSPEATKSSDSAYILFYQASDAPLAASTLNTAASSSAASSSSANPSFSVNASSGDAAQEPGLDAYQDKSQTDSSSYAKSTGQN
ncbi:Ubiquitin carboxyl-terminal hydrolase 46 [Cichlidogyrus casuarinus]|uniref:Ubiquitin carboxyl-terminal hydrolase n=1 Tax=Cichlidogyrus casuarinus TaxID=1844966 RepID=A0ABD2Q8C9_9PLAT